MDRRAVAYAAITLAPVPLLGAGALGAGAALWAGLALLAVAVPIADALAPQDRAGPMEPGGDALSLVLGGLHFPVLALGVHAVAGLPAPQAAAAFLGFGLWLGQVSNANAHELIHRPRRVVRLLGAAVFASHLFGHHATAHRAVHHVHVATARDPNSAPPGMSAWAFLPRAWAGSALAGWRIEASRLAARGRPAWHPSNPYWAYGAGALATLTAGGLIAGPAGVLAAAGLGLYATAQLLLSDYVQHYGLRRAVGPDGRPEPVLPAHSWNALHWASTRLMLNAPRHADHHAHPARPWPALRAPPRHAVAAPELPASLPAMATLALIPPLWFRVMDPRLDRLRQHAEARCASG